MKSECALDKVVLAIVGQNSGYKLAVHYLKFLQVNLKKIDENTNSIKINNEIVDKLSGKIWFTQVV